MFAINKEILSERMHPKEWAWMQSKFKEIRSEGKDFITFKAYSGIALNEEYETGRKVKIIRGRIVSQETTFFNSDLDLTQSWAYGATANAYENVHGKFELKKKGLYFPYEYILNVRDDIELIFYFRYISKNKSITEIDTDKENKQKAIKIIEETEAKNIIYSPKSPIHPDIIGTENAMRSIAISWGVSDIQNMSIYTVMDQLWNKVSFGQATYNHTHRGYKEFVEEVLKLGDGSKRTTVILGIQKEVLQFRDNVWYLTTKGGTEQIMCGVPIGDEKIKDEYIVKYLVSHDRAYKAVELSVQDGDNTVITEALKNPKRVELQKRCKAFGWSQNDLMKSKNDRLLEILKNQERKKE